MDYSILGPIILQLVLIFINAFFVCTEIAVITLNDMTLKNDAKSGNKKAQLIVRMTDKPARFLATIQIGITFAGFLASAFAAQSFSERFVDWLISMGISISYDTLSIISVIVITLLLSYFMLVLGELVPKRIAMNKAKTIAYTVSRVIFIFSKITAPLVWILTTSTNGLLRLFGFSPYKKKKSVTEEEIRLLINLGEEDGAIKPEEGEMIDNVLEFGNKSAVEIMTPRTDLVVLWMDNSPEEWEKIILSTNYSRYPVCAKSIDNVIGVLHIRDYFANLHKVKDGNYKKIIRSAFFIPETTLADVLFREMRSKKVHMAIIVDEYGGTSGIVTLEDLLEEIVGDIKDEHDNEELMITQLEDNLWRIKGSTYLEDLENLFNIKIPEGDYDTLGGLIFSRITAIPEDGQNLELDIAGLHINVESIRERRVEWVLVSKKDEQKNKA